MWTEQRVQRERERERDAAKVKKLRSGSGNVQNAGPHRTNRKTETKLMLRLLPPRSTLSDPEHSPFIKLCSPPAKLSAENEKGSYHYLTQVRRSLPRKS